MYPSLTASPIIGTVRLMHKENGMNILQMTLYDAWRVLIITVAKLSE